MTKLLSDADLDSFFLLQQSLGLSDSIAAKIIAQAKLANRIKKQAAEICAKEARIYYGTSIDGPASSVDYQRGLAADNCAAAILAMEIEHE